MIEMGVQHEKRVSENAGLENPGVQFTPGDDAWTRARTYAKSKMARHPLRLLLYTGHSTKDFNYEANREYRAFLTSLKIPHQTLLIPDVAHSTRQCYDKRAGELLKFHAEGIGKSDPAAR